MQSEGVRERQGERRRRRKKKKKDRRRSAGASSSQSFTVTARATCFNLSPLRAAKCVYKPNDCVLACFLPPRISVTASQSALLLWFHRDRQGMRHRETRCEGRRIEKPGFLFSPPNIIGGQIPSLLPQFSLSGTLHSLIDVHVQFNSCLSGIKDDDAYNL